MTTIPSTAGAADIGQQISAILAGAGAATAATAASGSGKAPSAGETEDRFLKLLVAQMRNQDPLNPLDNAQVTTQLAQISTVQGIEELNRTVAKLAGGSGINSPIDAIAMIGREVLSEGGRFAVSDDSPATLTAGFELAQAADAVQVQIVNASGETVYGNVLGPTAPGTQMFQWSAAGLPAGSYELKVQALVGGEVAVATPLAAARVLGVSQGSDGVRIELSGRGSILASSIKAVL
ncbi:MAG: hypothetical protein KJZ83_02270 [Burkholderiaceae bacterium]|nr:hypothetical protein [Burkholderiaceae bacterium]